MKEQELILKPNKLKQILLSFVCLLFVLCGVFVIEDQSLMRWAGIIFFGFGFLVLSIQMLPGALQLKLTDKGFEMTSLFRSHFTKWSDVKEFRIGSVPVGKFRQKAMLMYDYIDSHKKHSFGKNISKSLTGSQAGLPDNYGLKLPELFQLMTEWKQRHS